MTKFENLTITTQNKMPTKEYLNCITTQNIYNKSPSGISNRWHYFLLTDCCVPRGSMSSGFLFIPTVMHFLGTITMFSPTICGFTMGTDLLSIEVLTIFFLGTELLAAETELLTYGGPVVLAAPAPVVLAAPFFLVGPFFLVAGGASGC
jgi:hypothetical protein